MNISREEFSKALDKVGDNCWNSGYEMGYLKGFGDAVSQLNKFYLELLRGKEEYEQKKATVEFG